jgi:hypothetical protein
MAQIENNPNVLTSIDAQGRYHLGAAQVNTNLGQFPLYSAIATSRYNSLQTTLNRRFTRNAQVQVAYTYSKCLNNGSLTAQFGNASSGVMSNPYNQAFDWGLCNQDIQHTLRANGLMILPFHGNKLIEGWQISGIVSANTGPPFGVTTGINRIGSTYSGTSRPDVVAGCDPYAGAHTVALWFNPACFTLPPVGVLGNVQRNSLRGPNFVNADISLSKDTKISKISEAFNLQFRAEFFNIFNHTNYAIPAAGLWSSAPPAGVSAWSSAPGQGGNTQAGRITNYYGNPRQIQFGLKINF